MAIQTALVVDDSRSARYILQRLLERQQIHADGVGTAHEALSYLREYRPDVVFMDDMMPGMEGQEAIDRLAANPATANIPIVMYTGRDCPDLVNENQHGSVIGVLSKPFTQHDVDLLLKKLGGRMAPPVTARLLRQVAPAVKATERADISSRNMATRTVEARVAESHAAQSHTVSRTIEPSQVPTLHSVVSIAVKEDKPVVQEPVPQAQLGTEIAAAIDKKLAGIQADLGALIKAETQWSVEQLIAERITQGVQPQLRQLEQKMSQSLAELRQHQLDAREELLGERVPQLLNELEARQQQCLDELRQGFSQMPLDHAELTATVEDTVAAETAGLRVQLTEFIKTEIQRSIEHLLGELLINGVRPQIEQLEEGWRNAFSELRHELLCSQDQVLELRIPQLLQELERRQQQRMDDQYLSLIEGVREAAAVLGRLGR